MNLRDVGKLFKRFWNYLKQDTWHSWLVSIILLYLVVRLVFFPILHLATGSSMPLVIVESCSMYHGESLDSWWAGHADWYTSRNISKEEFYSYSLDNGLNKGDIIFVVKSDSYKKGDILIFGNNPGATAVNPTIHRVVSTSPLATKGDNNLVQLSKENNAYHIDETSISSDRILGRAVFRIPYAGWLKLIWFEPFRPVSERGLCTETQTFKLSG